ncbi:MAG: membrane protein insertase YidC [Bacteroidota bacterium]|nr:membrane protein insertase YidC [Bacteroidota bacterium]
MDKKSLTGFFLVAIVMFAWMYFNKPNEEQIKRQKFVADSLEMVRQSDSIKRVLIAQQQDTLPESKFSTNNDVSNNVNDTTIVTNGKTLDGIFAPFSTGKDTSFVLENDLLKIKIFSKGGMIVYSELKNYKTYDSMPLVLFDKESAKIDYSFSYNNNPISVSDMYFKPLGNKRVVSGDDSLSFSMMLNIGDGQYIEHKYTLYGNKYVVGYQIQFHGFNNIIPRNISYFDLHWDLKTKQLERKQNKQSARITRNISTVYYKYKDEKPDFLKIKTTEEELKGKIKWVSFKQHFFNQTLIAKDNYFIRGAVKNQDVENDLSKKDFSAILSFPFSHSDIETYSMDFYFGPNHYKTLKEVGLDMERQIFLGRGILRWVNTVMVIPIFNYFSKSIASYGIIILLLTLFIKMLLLPLTFKSYLSTAKMKLLKPELDALKEKVGNDKTKQQTEQMKLYKQAGVSPLGGCLPMLLQMPILIALFRFFPSSIELRQQAFLWAHDLSTYDSIWNFPNGFKIPGYGDHVSLFTLLMTVSTLIYTRMNSQMMGGAQQSQMKVIQYLMPIMFLGFFNNYSAGLSYYYFLANIITFGQQYLFKIFVNEDKLRKKIELNKKKKKTKPKSNFQKRLENMQRQQKQQNRKR